MSRIYPVAPFVQVGAIVGTAVGTVASLYAAPALCRTFTHYWHGEYDEGIKYIKNEHEKMFPPFITAINDPKFETYWECIAIFIPVNTMSWVIQGGIAGGIVGGVVGLARHVFNKVRHGA